MAGDDNKTIQSLYPFLHGKKQDPGAMNAALLTAVDEKRANHRAVIDGFFADHTQAVIDAAGAIADCYRGNGRLFTMGNGGSSCDAAHVAVEFQHPVTAGRPALTAIDMSADRTMLTAGRQRCRLRSYLHPSGHRPGPGRRRPDRTFDQRQFTQSRQGFR
jgi:D-sedoheptulose 7-phosphate isomerase